WGHATYSRRIRGHPEASQPKLRRRLLVLEAVALLPATARSRTEARATNLACRLAADARRAVAAANTSRPDPFGWMPVHEHRSRELDLPALRLLSGVDGYPGDFLLGLRPARRPL